jgi:pyruvate-formate lyase-activating enzyme
VRAGFVTQFGSSAGAFFSDVLLASMCADARARGHEGHPLHVYWDGRDDANDAEVRRRFVAWAEAHALDVLVVERVVDVATVAALRRARPDLVIVLVARGEGFAQIEGVDWALVDDAQAVTPGLRAHPTDEFRRAFVRWLDAPDEASREDVPGMARLHAGEPRAPKSSIAVLRSRERLGFAPALDGETLFLGADGPPPRWYTVYGNAGCPYARDVAEVAAYRGLPVLDAPPAHAAGELSGLARYGCSFCHMGGDYEKRADEEVVAGVVDQVAYLLAALPDLDRVILSDQNPQRYLARLLEVAASRGLRPLRWLIQTRADAFLRDLEHVRRATEVAERVGARLALYLVGFESFSDEELERYNKGLSADTLVAAVGAMRALRESSRGRFDFAEIRGHSLILFNPWTRPSHLLESAEAMRANGLAELFHDVAWNRLRLYPNLPIHHLAARDGLIADAFADASLAGATREKGYNVETPWRFQDARTALAYELCARLKRTLGREGELAQLRAVSRFAGALEAGAPVGGDVGGLEAGAPVGGDVGGEALAHVERGVARLSSVLETIERRAHGRHERAGVVAFAGGCNNGCAGCANRDAYLDDATAALEARVDAARAEGGPIVLAGREPTIHPAFLSLVARARLSREARSIREPRPVAVVTNGRRFALLRFAAAAARAGLTAASLKLFGASAEIADGYARVPGAHAQALEGAANLQRVGVALELRVTLHEAALDSLADVADVASRLGVRTLRAEVALDEVGLAHLEACASALERLAERCTARGIDLHATPLGRGARQFDDFPATARRES